MELEVSGIDAIGVAYLIYQDYRRKVRYSIGTVTLKEIPINESRNGPDARI